MHILNTFLNKNRHNNNVWQHQKWEFVVLDLVYIAKYFWIFSLYIFGKDEGIYFYFKCYLFYWSSNVFENIYSFSLLIQFIKNIQNLPTEIKERLKISPKNEKKKKKLIRCIKHFNTHNKMKDVFKQIWNIRIVKCVQ